MAKHCSICLRSSNVVDFKIMEENLIICSGCRNQFYKQYKEIYSHIFAIPNLLKILTDIKIQPVNPFTSYLFNFLNTPVGCHEYNEFHKPCKLANVEVRICPKCRFRKLFFMVKPRTASSMKVGAVNRCYRKILEEWASVTTILKGMLRNRKLVAESGNEDKAVVKVKSEMRQNIHSLPLTISEKAFSNI